jgi:uncharacterized membrane protein
MTDAVPEEAGAAIPETERRLGNRALAGYLLLAAGLLFFPAALVGLVLAWVWRRRARDTWLASHFTWQIRTFWLPLLAVLAGVAGWFAIMIVFLSSTRPPAVDAFPWFLFPAVALFGLFSVAVQAWVLYRVVRGWLALSDRRPVRPAKSASSGSGP